MSMIYDSISARETVLDVVRRIQPLKDMDVTAASLDRDDQWINLTVTIDGKTYERHLRRSVADRHADAYSIAKGFQDMGREHQRTLTEENP